LSTESVLNFQWHHPPQYQCLECCWDYHSFQFDMDHMLQYKEVHNVGMHR